MYDEPIKASRSQRTGTRVELWDASDLGIDGSEDAGGRWVTYCVAHDEFVQHLTRRLAESFMPVPDEFCYVCQENTKDKE